MKRCPWLLVIALLLGANLAVAQVCDLAEISTSSTPGMPSRVLVAGSVAYLAAGSTGIVRVNISDPQQLTIRGTDTTDGPVNDLELDYFRDLVVTAEGDAGVGAHAISGGATSPVGVTDVGETVVSISGDGGVFFAGSEQGSVFILSVSASDPPELVGSLAVGGEVVDIVRHSNRLYCALGTGAAIAIVDIGDPEAPQLVATHDLAGPVRSLVRTGNRILAAVDGAGVVVLEIDGDVLVEVNSAPLDAPAEQVVEWTGRVYAAGPDLGLVELDTSLVVDIIPIASLDLPGASGMALVGEVLYVARGSNGITSVNVEGCTTSTSILTTSFLPAAARARGDVGTYWVTDLAVANLTKGLATINFGYLIKGRENQNPLDVSLALAPGEQVLLEDVFWSLFGREQANGGLRIIASHRDVKITSRTYNTEGSEGTYGQFIPALGSDTAVVPGAPGSLLQLRQNAMFRTNIGLVNLTALDVEVEIHLFSAAGSALGVVSRTLEPYEMNQVDKIFQAVTSDPVDSGFALVKVLTSEGAVLAYASVVDNGSGDPIYIPAQILSSGWPF